MPLPQNRHWLASYPAGIPAEIDPARYNCLTDFLTHCRQRYGDLPAFDHMGRSISYAQLDDLSRAFAACLQNHFGIRKGDRVALMMPNILAYPVALFGVLRCGAIVVNINPLYTARELANILDDSGATAIVIMENFNRGLHRICDQTGIRHIIHTRLGDLHTPIRGWLMNVYLHHIRRMKPVLGLPYTPFSACLASPGPEYRDADIAPDDIAFLQYTGGTTGKAKGAMLTQRNIIANILQGNAWLKEHFEGRGSQIITALPLYHVFALTANCMISLSLGACSHLITNPRDMKTFIRTLRRVPFNIITGVNTLYNALLHQPGFRELDFSTLQMAMAGGMALQADTDRRWHELTGRHIIEAYGLTETSPAVCFNPVDLKVYNGAIGLPLPSTEVCICDSQGRPLDAGKAGELWVRGPQVMKGYWNAPEETREVLNEDGWLRTGDIATIDADGFIRIVDRMKDMILVSGFNVYPNEIEQVLTSHPDILEAGVIGIPDEDTGEAIKAIIVQHAESMDAEAVKAYCHTQLTAYKVPKVIEFRNELPKTHIGKVSRRELR